MPLNSSGMYDQRASWTGTAIAGDGSHTNAAPSSATDGLDITDCTGFRFIVSADSGHTLTSYTGRVWLYSVSLARWVHNAQLDYTPTITSGLWRDDVSPDFECALGYGRAYLQLVNPSVDSGNCTPQGESGKLNAFR